MQKLQCELCGSIDIIKTGENVFQCQHCGCKYTLEQVKTLIFGGEVKTKATDFEIVAGVLKKYNGESIDVIIPDNVIRIEDKVFENLPIRSVRFPDSLTAIGDNAFRWCRNLSFIYLPDSINYIGGGSFSHTAITEVKIPSAMTHVICFQDCTALKKVILPTSITHCDFSGCHSLKSLELPNSLVVCNFSRCSSMTNIDLPKNTEYACFKGCTSLVSVQLPQGIRIVDFQGCTSLASIQLPQSIRSVFFKGCTSLVSIQLPNGISTIGKETFSGCRSLQTVKLPSDLACIEKGAFNGCISLQNMVVPDKVKSDWKKNEYEYSFSHCFEGCDMKSISTPENRKWMKDGHCRYCGSASFRSTGFLGLEKICSGCNRKKDY